MATNLEESRVVSPFVIISGMMMYSILAYGMGARSNFVISSIGNTLAIPASIYVYFGVASLAFRGRFVLLALGVVSAIVIAVLLTSQELLMPIVNLWGMKIAGGALLGWLVNRKHDSFRAYLYGLGAVSILIILWLLSKWPIIQSLMQISGDEISGLLATAGFVATEQMIQDVQMIIGKVSRFIPGSLYITILIEYSAGALLFLTLLERSNPREKRLAPFTHWQMPFWVLIILPVSVAARFLIGGTAGLIADNLLLILSVFYCVTGLSLVDFYIRKIRLSLLAKIAVYLLFLPLGPIGYMGLCLCGVLDSFYDWRKISLEDEQLEKSVV